MSDHRNGNASRQRILDFVQAYWAERGYAPTLREICAGAQLSAPSTALAHVRKLAADGKVQYVPGRTLRVVE